MRWILSYVALYVALLTAGVPGVSAAPYAAIVIEGDSGEVLHARNAQTRLHPASLTMMMTLYVAFSAIENGEVSLDSVFTISRHAASEPPSKLGMRAGQKIQLRYLIRATALKSANDAATAIAEGISGTEVAFVARMNLTATQLGLAATNFRNAHGLTENGHLSTAQDMAHLTQKLLYDFPQYYNLFSRRSTSVGETEVQNTNRRFLDSYWGADGVKTGYTRAAGFNLAASAERGGRRLIAVVFGSSSTTERNQRVGELLDLGFSRAPDSSIARSEPEAGKDVEEIPELVPSLLRPAARPMPSVSENALLRPPQLPSGVPIIRALDGPFRIVPENAGNNVAVLEEPWQAMFDFPKSNDAEVASLTRIGIFDTPVDALKAVLHTSLGMAAAAQAIDLNIVPMSMNGTDGFGFVLGFASGEESDQLCASLSQTTYSCQLIE